MAYYVRLLTPSSKVVEFAAVAQQGTTIRLAEGTEAQWNRIEVFEPEDNLIAKVERIAAADDKFDSILAGLRDSLQDGCPESARQWIRNYLFQVRAVYVFQLLSDNITTREQWQTLGRIQNLLKDALAGIIQADSEGFYNENGDYILWRMYAGAKGFIPAAVLDEKGEWVNFALNISNAKAVESFKQGLPPKKGFWGLLFRT